MVSDNMDPLQFAYQPNINPSASGLTTKTSVLSWSNCKKLSAIQDLKNKIQLKRAHVFRRHGNIQLYIIISVTVEVDAMSPHDIPK